ncbi:NAD(P)H-binding protein [Mycolicibacterium rufum]|uniref:NAD(P)H-binding protein n=1 Tax=Mycolicibacterium rufum TaxID=318424 RepID=A0A9X2YFE0_9MYCO|nr:NAD(P)H-binding protein [Mycolicibacterium rufum]KGI69570.1 hydroxylase [Mycolicibacterium rufum]MCV7072283.1 NAD(P)H-binding protein [Mycolicibacterium rufum]ULP35799.1 NAD(P)H-binding protein [Mycolicibacterium rufum]
MSGPVYLVTGAGGGTGGVSRHVVERLIAAGCRVRAYVHRDDDRAARLRTLGVDVAVGDLTRPRDVVAAVAGVDRVFFSMSVSPEYLAATAVMASAVLEEGTVEALVNMSQMTVSQMTLTSTEESDQHRLHYLAEQVLNWSGLPVVHMRPTAFLDNPLFTWLAAPGVRNNGVLALPFGSGRTSPIAAGDVARAVTAVLTDPGPHIGKVYELTGPAALDIEGLAAEYATALGRPVRGTDIEHDRWLRDVLDPLGLPGHLRQHLETMALLHRAGRYDRSTGDYTALTGQPAQTPAQYVRTHADVFA